MDWKTKEQGVVEKICDDKWALAHAVDVVLTTAFRDLHEFQLVRNLCVSLSVKRTELGLSPLAKPGDIDLLIIPHNGSTLMWNRTIAIELKVVRPTVTKPGKNSGSLGVSQATGLLRDGFPFVGLVHVILPETRPRELLGLIPMMSDETDAQGQLKGTGEFFPFDPFPIASARRQEGRLIAANVPPQVSWRVISLLTDHRTGELTGCTLGEHKHGAVNPSRSADLLDATRTFFEDNPNRFRYIGWSDSL